ncbi:hypothetical protein DFH09DRAFT_1339728 [Mycena vulgaris]|nr:hypothetical protein DFH09DRAFT_1339728 [Mycena vulgaris]
MDWIELPKATQQWDAPAAASSSPTDRSSRIQKLQCWDTAETESFPPITLSHYRGAAGASLLLLLISVRNLTILCWDTAGTESSRSCTRFYYRGAAGCLLGYDFVSRRSFKNVCNRLADVRAHADAHGCIFMRNKLDLCEGVVSGFFPVSSE